MIPTREGASRDSSQSIANVRRRCASREVMGGTLLGYPLRESTRAADDPAPAGAPRGGHAAGPRIGLTTRGSFVPHPGGVMTRGGVRQEYPPAADAGPVRTRGATPDPSDPGMIGDGARPA